MESILDQWQIHNQSFFTWSFCIKFGLKIRFVDQNMKPKRVLYAGHVGPHFRGGILDFWSYLLELHGKKCRTILKILPWNLKFMSIYELVVLNTSNGLFVFNLIKDLIFCSQKSHYFYSNSHWTAAVFKYLLLWSEFTCHILTNQGPVTSTSRIAR